MKNQRVLLSWISPKKPVVNAASTRLWSCLPYALIFSFITFCFFNVTATPPPISGTRTVGTGGNYQNLTEAFDDIDMNGLNGNLTLQLIAGYPAAAETYPIVSCNATAVGTFTVHIYPAVSGLSISSSTGFPSTLEFNLSKNIILDGRVNGTGSTKDLIVENTGTGSAIRFANDATNTTVQYCIIRAISTSSTQGVVNFSNSAVTLGNSNNTITNNDIKDGASTPAVCIYATGNVTAPNNNNTISNNNIYNFYHSTSTSVAGLGISIANNNNSWTITGNSFYQTVTRSAFGTSGPVFSFIQLVGTNVNGMIISNNFMGGTAPMCGGAPLTLTASSPLVFRGITATVGTTTATSLQGNTIQNISISTTSINASQACIHLAVGSFNCGNITGNAIGSQVAANSITFSSSGALSIFSGIMAAAASPGVVNISNNSIGGITISSSTSLSFRGINAQNSATSYTISNNTIGSPSVTNSISNSTTSSLTGIFSSSSSALSTISNNTIANLTQLTTNASSFLIGISLPSSSGVFTTTGNTIHNLTSSSTGIGAGSSASVIGISHAAATTAGQTLSQNVIHTLSNTTPSAAANVSGIYFAGPATISNLLSGNFIHSLHASSDAATITGIAAAGGKATYRNNMIRLGVDASGNSITNSAAFIGMDKTSVVDSNNIYHNSFYIGGVSVASGTTNSIVFRRTSTSIDDVRNNIFANYRSNASGTGKHYAIGVSATTSLTLDYNAYGGNGTGFTLGYMGAPGATDYPTLADWQAGASKDAASVFGDPQFISPAGTSATVNLHIHPTLSTTVEAVGVLIASVINDYDNQTRSMFTPVDIGADAGDFVTSPGMTFVSCSTTQSNTSDVMINSTNQEVIGIQIVTSGATNPLSVTQFSLNTNGTTSTADITNAKLFYTGTSSSFATTTQVGNTVLSPSGSFMIDLAQDLVEGTNYFWLTYDVPCGPGIGNSIDAECNSIVVGSSHTPTVQAPAGARIIVGSTTGEVMNADDSGAGSLRDVIACVGNNATISINSSLIGSTITLTSGEILIDKNISIIGFGVNDLIISGNSVSRIFRVTPGNTLALQGMTLTGASALENGGAIYVEGDGLSNGGSLYLNNVTIQNSFQNGVPKSLTLALPSNLEIIGTVDMKN